MRLFSEANSFHLIIGSYPLLPTQGHHFTKHLLYSASSVFFCFQSVITSTAKSHDQFSVLIVLDRFITLTAVESSLPCEILSSLVINLLSPGSPRASVAAFLIHLSLFLIVMESLHVRTPEGPALRILLCFCTCSTYFHRLSMATFKIISLAQLLP